MTGRVTSLLAKVLPLAAGAAVSPTVFAAVVLVLSGTVRPLARAGGLAAGAAAPLVVLAAAGLIGFRHAGSGDRLRISPVVDLVFGVVLLLLAVRAWRRPAGGGAGGDGHPSRLLSAGPAVCALLGAGLMLTNFSTLALFVPLVKEVAIAGSVGLAAQLAVLAASLVIALVTVWLPPLVYALSPERSGALLGTVSAATRRHSRAVGVGICLVFGVYLCVKAALRL